MTTKSAILGIGWLTTVVAIGCAMLAHIIKNRITIGRWWI